MKRQPCWNVPQLLTSTQHPAAGRAHGPDLVHPGGQTHCAGLAQSCFLHQLQCSVCTETALSYSEGLNLDFFYYFFLIIGGTLQQNKQTNKINPSASQMALLATGQLGKLFQLLFLLSFLLLLKTVLI